MRLISPTVFTRAAFACALAVAVACDNTTEPSTPASITVNSGGTVTGAAGGITPVSVTVLTSNGRALSGTPVTFAVTSGGGSVTPTTTNTDANGQASASWTYGNTLGAQVLTITAGGISQTVTATVRAGNPASVTFTAGQNQTATVGTAVATPPAVTVRDAGNNPVSGVQVNFTTTPGGTVAPATVTTDANGVARVTTWALGTQAGTYTLQATVLASGVTGNPASITATATAGTASQVTVASGIATTGVVGTALSGAALPAVVVRDVNGNPVAGATVTFTSTSGGGTITGGTATSNAQGVATVGGFTLGQTVGTNTITASVQGGGSVQISIAGTAGTAASSAVAGGNNQAVGAGQVLAVGPSVRVVDRFGNPVAGVTVNFLVTQGGGSLLGATQTTNAQGIATVGGVTLGPTPGANTIVARIAGLPDVTFTATGLAGAPASIARVSPESTTVVTNSPSANPLRVLVRDAAGFPVQGAVVTFAVTGGSGTVSSVTATTDATGQASTTFTGGGTLGPATVTATVNGVTTTFTVTVQRSTPSQVVLVQGNNQTATVGTAVGLVPTVRVTDAQGRPVPGVEVQFRVVTQNLGGGVNFPIDTTDAAGLADPGQWILGTIPGQNELSIVVSEPLIQGNPVRVVATSVAAPVNPSITIIQGNNQTARAGTFVPVNPVVEVRNSAGAVLPNATVQFLVSGPSADAAVSQQFVQTDANGRATVSWRLATSPGQNTLTAIVNGANVQVQFIATGT